MNKESSGPAGDVPLAGDVPAADVGGVVIGRNEGDRLVRCLESIVHRVPHVVYVDSGSTDGSPERARALGALVVDLDMERPFTAARARNEGFAALLRRAPSVRYVQFVDGDCEVAADWIETARRHLDVDAQAAVVCGRRRERFPERSVFNRVCDVEWDTPVGEADACGGDALMRVSAFESVDGFNPQIIAGEEPELCVRLREQNWKIVRIDAEMTLHDAAMTRVSQWWRRCVRAGHAFAEGADRHGAPPARLFVRESRRAWFWGGVVPGLAFGGALPSLGGSLVLLAGYPVSAARAFQSTRRRGRSRTDAAAHALSCTLGKFPELVGMVKYHRRKFRGEQPRIIEYKSAGD